MPTVMRTCSMTRQDKITAAVPCGTTPATMSPEKVVGVGYSDDGWGNQPRCITCRKGISNCFCDAPDIEDMAAGDVSRIMGWELAERSAFGMVKL
jgi:hypothetical protein